MPRTNDRKFTANGRMPADWGLQSIIEEFIPFAWNAKIILLQHIWIIKATERHGSKFSNWWVKSVLRHVASSGERSGNGNSNAAPRGHTSAYPYEIILQDSSEGPMYSKWGTLFVTKSGPWRKKSDCAEVYYSRPCGDQNFSGSGLSRHIWVLGTRAVPAFETLYRKGKGRKPFFDCHRDFIAFHLWLGWEGEQALRVLGVWAIVKVTRG